MLGGQKKTETSIIHYRLKCADSMCKASILIALLDYAFAFASETDKN